jgi:coenzyme F420 hydrogenase subunit beta
MSKIPAKPGFKETLATIVDSKRCTGCAACIVSCPFKCLGYAARTPELTADCHSCGICSNVCPRYNNQLGKLEEFVFGREARPEEGFGVYREIMVARSTNERILNVCQDGGAVSTLLAYGLSNEKLDGAAVAGIDETRPLFPTPTLVTTAEEVIKCAGSRYFYSPNLIALQKGLDQKKKALALVGTPCQIQAARKLQIFSKNYREKIKLLIGLMCSETFLYQGFMKTYLGDQLGIDLNDIRKMNIKGKLILTMKSGLSKEIPLKEVKKYVRNSCNICDDFPARLADISVGGLGLNGWSLVIARTEVGCKFLEETTEKGMLRVRPISEEKTSLDLLIKMSNTRMSRHAT